MSQPFAVLEALLLSIFSVPADLRGFLRRLEPAYDRLVDELPSDPVSHAQLVHEAARALVRRGLADSVFFDGLRSAFRGRSTDIDAVERALAEPPAAGGERPTADVRQRAAPAAREPRPDTMHQPVRILHLSDLHARQKTEWDARPLLARLVQALGELRAEGRGPDLIAITGDLAFSGQAAEYKLVEAWLTEALLPAAGVGADRLLIVPGNHDVDRSACRSETIMALEARLREGDSARIAAVLSDPPQRKLVHQRYKHYLAFLKRVGVAHPIAPSWSWRTEVRGTGLHIAGLDTAWLASEEHVQGRLALGLSVVNAHLPTPGQRDRDIVIALTHHPLSWLVQRDQSEVRAPLLARAHLHLRGHLHEADYSYTQSPQHRLIELPAGATYAGHGWPMSFQLIELDGAAGQGRVSLRAWQRDWDAWVSDRTKLPPDGDWTFPLRWAP